MTAQAHRIADPVLSGHGVYLFDVVPQSGIVIVRPVPHLRTIVPRQCTQAQDPVGKFLENKLSFQIRIVLQNNQYVVCGFQGLSGFRMYLQQLHPVRIFRRCSPERCRSSGVPFLQQQLCYAGVFDRIITRRLIGRQLVCRRIRLCIAVLVAEQMQPHQVKRIAQLAACRIVCVVGKEKLAALIDHRTAGSCTTGIGEAISGITHRVLVRQDLCNDLVHVIYPAERPHHAGLLCRICLLCSPRDFRCSQPRPLFHVPPVGVHSQNAVGIGEILVPVGVDVGTVRTARRPVHQP